MKTPAPQRAAGRKKLAAAGQALSDGTAPIPDLAYLRKAIRAKGRVDPAKWPALKALIIKRAKELKATNAAGVKGTWAFQAANDTEAIDLAAATARRQMPPVRGAADVQLTRAPSGVITAVHKSGGVRIGVIAPAGKGWAGRHADGTATAPSGSQQGALTALIAHHNAAARRLPLAQQGGAAAGPGSRTYTGGEQLALDLAGALPYTSNASSSDGPRVTSMGGGKPDGSGTAGLSPYAAAIYKKLLAKGLKPGAALAMAKRADAMHAKAAGPKASAA